MNEDPQSEIRETEQHEAARLRSISGDALAAVIIENHRDYEELPCKPSLTEIRLAELTADSYRREARESSLTRTDSCSSRYRPSDVRDPKRQGFGPAMCVRHVDVRVICILHNDAQFAAFFVDPRAK